MFTLYNQWIIFDAIWGGSAPTVNVKIGLSSTPPNIEGGNITNPGGNYAPVSLTTDDFSIVEVGSPLTDVYVKNDDAVVFIESGPSTPWGTVSHWTLEIEISPSVFELYDYGLITNRLTGEPEPKTIGTEDIFSFDPDKLIFRFKNT